MTVYVRIPVPRNGIQDPIPTNWNSNKETELWNHLQSGKTDPGQLATLFDVSINFIQMQSKYLYSRELERLKTNMQKLSTKQTETSFNSIDFIDEEDDEESYSGFLNPNV